ncbi:hypothetical protein JNUCC1_01121 [Lentibacillus sp. JNUCC-1]|uniref:O-antigen ligase family protein n=1 Tax=Lentibacillus sp. JNUCC-1 TaxID=2654513 RepID=UPI0012E92192|nr:O-antigen ligase family protein [Lentibacillus sp. JNUCC-1]MUV37315.1 hypothetical protein [Lentibacillus sp. JNUCC-1]
MHTKESWFFLLLFYFIMLQPILDILTTFSLYINLNITVGIIVRMLFMIVSLAYIFFFSKESPYKKQIIIYLVLVIITLSTSFIGNIFFKPTFNLLLEAQWSAKIFYYIVMFCSLFLVLSVQKSYHRIKVQLLKAIYAALLIVIGTVFVAIITGSSNNTYEWVKSGYKGWFYSGNELGAILAVTLPLVFLYTVIKTNNIKDYKYWFGPLLLAVTGMIIGTKVGLFAVIGCLLVMLISVSIHWMTHIKKEGIQNKYYKVFLFSISLSIVFTIIAPFTPSITNLSVSMPIPDKDKIVQEQDKERHLEQNENSIEEESTEDKRKLPAWLDSSIVNKILSSRHFYVTRQYYQFEDANIFQKIFGMGYAGNYTSTRKTIEMDYLDAFFSFGVVGFLLISAPLALIFIIFIKAMLFSVKQVLDIKNILMGTSIILGSSIALIAGHIWFSPAVSLYYSIAICLLFFNLKHYGEKFTKKPA